MKMRKLTPLLVAALLGVAVAVAVSSCGSSTAGLIPSADAGPLQSDFEAVASAAAAGNGNCSATESALGKTEQDFLALPASIDRGLRSRLRQGISNLRRRALAMCIQPVPTATTTTPTETTPTTTTPTQTTPTETTPSTPTSEAPSTTPTPTPPSSGEQGGGTEAPNEPNEHGGTAPEGAGEGDQHDSGGANAEEGAVREHPH
jgi:hypothetical protein